MSDDHNNNDDDKFKKKIEEWEKKIKEREKEIEEQGNARIQYYLGRFYHNGWGVKKDYRQAFKWWKKSAQQGNARAQHRLGKAYSNGWGVKQDYDEAVKWYRKSVEQGNANAQCNLGLAYYNGEGVDQDYKQAVYLWKKLAQQGNAVAQNNLGSCYYNGHGVKQDYKQAVEWYRKSADQGYDGAQLNLGSCYRNAHGVKQDYDKAIELWEKSAEQGDAFAQCNLGRAYYFGKGVEKDYKQAVYWYIKSAQQDNDKAQFYLGVAYHLGQGIKQDYKQAVEWYTKSAEQGNADAQNNLGFMYYHIGRGVKNYYDEVVKWYRKSAEQGYEIYHYNLLSMYRYGQRFEQYYKQAFEWWKKSANNGNSDAQLSLGTIYERGACGVKKDFNEAVKWYRYSLNRGLTGQPKPKIDNLPLASIVFEIHSVLKELKVNNFRDISLTHFTSFEVFKKVIQKGIVNKLRLSDVNGCNDPMEGKTLFECLEHDEFKNYTYKDSYPLILSFCDGNPENLPMWNTYADNSKGVGLSLTEDSIKKLINPSKNFPVKIDINLDNSQQATLPNLYNVMYLPRNKEITEIKEEDLKNKKQFKALKHLQEAVKKIDDIMNGDYDEKLRAQLPKLLAELAHIVKYDDYAYEKEIRLVQFAFKDDIKSGVLKSCSDTSRVYVEAPKVDFELITIAPKVGEKEYLYARYFGDSNYIEVKKSEIKFQ
jgi:hypothetical protein